MTLALFWRAAAPLVLASASASRARILSAAGIPFEVRISDVDERAIEAPLLASKAGPAAIASALANAKARPVSAAAPDRLVLGADQTLDLDGALFHKAVDRAEAEAQLAALAGRKHRLTSAVALLRDGASLGLVVSEARMTMRPLDKALIGEYLDAAGPDVLRGVGCYQIEGLGVHLFDRIEGDLFTVRGLPLTGLLALLRREGALA